MASDDENDLMSDLMRAVQAEKELSERLGDYVGQWVAVRDHEVVAHASTLAALLDEINPDSVEGVFQVAEEGTASFF